MGKPLLSIFLSSPRNPCHSLALSLLPYSKILLQSLFLYQLSLSVSVSLSLQFLIPERGELLYEHVATCLKLVNHRYECINIPNFFSRCVPKQKITANVGSFIFGLSLTASSSPIEEMFCLAWTFVIFSKR